MAGSQPAPELAAGGGFERSPATVFVPPNDPETRLIGNRSVIPAFRRRQPRRFPAFRPDDPMVRLVWRDVDADAGRVAALNALAADTPYIGHSSSLTRCHFRVGEVAEQTALPRRRVYRGRLAELESKYRAGQRPNPGESVRVGAAAVASEPPSSAFADRWLVLEHVDGEMPDLRAAALVARALRHAVMSGYKKIGQEASIPAIVSGHAADGSPVAETHLAIAPLAFLGPRFADGHVLGFALIPPRRSELLADEDFRNALRAIAEWKQDEGRRELKLAGNGLDLAFAPTGESALRSLDPAPYVAVAKTWATCTPIVMDRHLKAKGNAERDAEIANLVNHACSNIGLPEPVRISVGKHSAVRGAPSAYPSGRAPRWTGWRLPNSLASRQLIHAVLQFETPMPGPVIVGAGRFLGLGLCRALDAEGR
jgi:CRISPR-associated protein Csb2